MKTVIRIVLAILAIFTIHHNRTYCQNVGINTENPDQSAMLHIESSDKGILIPRINITALNSASPVSNPAVGLLVYNTNTSTGPGFFYWSGSSWVSLFSKVDFDATPAASITNTQISNWNTAYSWGNHASAGYASVSHTHDASHIVSGTLSVARGGTGISNYTTGNYIYASGPTTLSQRTPAQVLSDIGAAASSHSHANLTFNNSGSGASTGSIYNGSSALTISYNTIGAAASSHSHATLTRGNYLTGSNYDGSSTTTWAVDATSTNTANKVIARDANGDFAAGNITSTNLYVYNTANSGWAGFTSYRNAATGNNASDGSAIGLNGTNLWINNYENSNIFFGTQNTSRMAINESGNVGIGTDAPTQKLEVAGNLKLTNGHLFASGAISNYGTISFYGIKGGYGGINFRDASGNNIATLMIHSQYQGIYNSNDNAWLWYWDNGTLAAGTVPVARISGTLPVSQGGTGATSFNSGAILTGNGTGAIQSTLTYSTAASANTIVQRNSSGYVYANYFNTTANVTSTVASHFAVQTGSDNFIRWQTPTDARNSLGIRTVSVVMTITPNSWNLVTHNLNISSNTNWYAIATNGDQSANNFNISRSPNWANSNQCWVYIEGGTAGNGRINIVVF